MGNISSFKQEFSFDERLNDSKNIIAKYPDRVPVIIEKYSRTDMPELDKKNFLVPRDMSVGQFIHILSSGLHLTPGKAVFVFVKNTYLRLLKLIFNKFCYSDSPSLFSSKLMHINDFHV